MWIAKSIEEEMLFKSELLKTIAALRIDRQTVKQEEMVVIMCQEHFNPQEWNEINWIRTGSRNGYPKVGMQIVQHICRTLLITLEGPESSIDPNPTQRELYVEL